MNDQSFFRVLDSPTQKELVSGKILLLCSLSCLSFVSRASCIMESNDTLFLARDIISVLICLASLGGRLLAGLHGRSAACHDAAWPIAILYWTVIPWTI